MNDSAAPPSPYRLHSSHWGVFNAAWQNGELRVKPYEGDPDPNRIIDNFPTALRHRARIARPMVRRGWLERGAGPDTARGRDDFVPMEWDLRRLLRLVQCRALPPRAKPGPPVSQHRPRRLRPLRQQLQLRRLLGAGAAHPRQL
jgi:hypothetical protein